ncbi:dTDP-glucose 4,6-dehydratase [candidate division WWE3 bacterium]|jgi:dTDP-glucose 4,6-dehydratase|uniref:dTDP-glucose 4,6-dehydratase n=1 Tax=candidate division WWE3 bacterium TaxID=2053526 RepID=A0A3A4ZAX8_UNCKA|nr:MAG: dTDP-glucose 4,6-dehydratase [candidate division WWE3 bacterium]
MKLLITGACGFIGTNFILRYVKNHPEDEIINVDKLTYAANKKVNNLLTGNKRYNFIQEDICNYPAMEEIMKGVDVVVHFAAESHVDRSIQNPEIFLKTNIFGTHSLLEAALKNNVKRFHHVSTDEVFGELSLEGEEKFTENTQYDPRSPYSASKAASDHLVRSYYATYGLPVTTSNCSNNYGPFASPEKFIPRSITNLLQNTPIKIYGDGKYIRDWLFVEDHCIAIETIIEKGRVGETYLVGGLTKDITNLELAEMLLEITGKDKSYIEFIKDRPGHDKRYSVDWTKLNKELGWTPTLTLRTGLEKTVEWYKNNEEFWNEAKKVAEKFYSQNV